MPDPIQTVIIKAVSFCNLGCTYCSAHCDGRLPRQVSPECVLTVFRELLEDRRIDSRCKVLWHGGEPTLYDPRNADRIMSELLRMGKELAVGFDFIMQTNGFSISPEWLRLIGKYGIGLGISCDGPEKIHDACRKTASRTGSYRNVAATIRTLSELKIPVSLLSVIDRRQAEDVDAFYDWAAGLNLPIKLNPRFSENMDPADFRNYYRFLRDFLCRYLRGDADFPVEPLSGMLRSMLRDSPAAECAYSGNCGRHILCIDHSDRLSACGRVADRGGCAHPVVAGRVVETVDKIGLQAENALRERFELRQCRSCEHFAHCHAGCSAYLDRGNVAFYCEAFRDFRDFMSGDALKLLKERLLRERESISAQLKRLGKHDG